MIDIQYWFSLFAVAQGAAVLGLTIFIFMYYLPKRKSHIKENMRWHVILIAASYIMLTSCTVQTAAMQFYRWGNIWYWFTTIAYIVGDISLIFIFREVAKRDRIKKILEGQNKK